MLEVLICEKTGWTHQEYDEQPDWLIDLMASKMEAESMFSKKGHD